MKALLALLFLAGCESSTGCERVDNPIELVPGDFAYEIRAKMVEDMKADGWDCSDTETIRNAFGAEIGVRYNCTTCR